MPAESDGKKDNLRRIGKQFEDAAAEYLVEKGYKIVDRNYHFRRFAEVDIIAQKDDTVVFVEVKSRKSNYFGTPAEAVTFNKKRKILFLADHYLAQNNLTDKAVRFDVIEIYFNHVDGEACRIISINHIENAF